MVPQGEAVGDLIATHQQRLYGYFLGRVRDDSVARDLAQETWIEVWRRADTFDPHRGGFWTFTRIWADFVFKRHGTALSVERKHRAEERVPVTLGDPDASTNATMVSGTMVGPTVGGSRGGVEHAVQCAAAFAELLSRVARCARPPHEVIVFGFNKLGWKPGDVVSELADLPMGVLAARLEREYAAATAVPAVHQAFAPLRNKLSRTLGEVVRDPRTRALCAALLDRVVETTALREYFSAAAVRDPEAAIVHWWHSVQRSVIAETVRDGHGNLFEWLSANGE
ncbi:sigma-70 family RNA polymerase sigma factor [Candidatus Binatia bacterium]|nr:sigma-70 family RNA polymerase sigma factor [Candidatus Binatia bacterium]